MISEKNILASFAMLKVEHMSDGRDYLDNYRNFVLYTIESTGKKIVTPEDIKSDLKNIFAFELPLTIISILLKKMSDNLTFSSSDGLYHYVGANNFNFREFEHNFLISQKQINLLSQKFIDYYDSYCHEKITHDVSMGIIISFLKDFSLYILPAYYKGKTTSSVFADQPSLKTKEMVYICKFIQDIEKENTALFADFIELVKGCFISNAIFIQDDDMSYKTMFNSVTFYLDAPLLIRLYGLEGELKQKTISETLQLVQALGGKFAVFSHCCDEFFAIVNRVIRAIRGEFQGRGPVYEEVRSPLSKWNETELLLIKSDFKSFLRKYNINYRQTPDYAIDFQIDELELQNVIKSKISYYHDPQDPNDASKAIQNDINSIRSIYALRGNTKPNSIETALAVFVTHNKALADAATTFRNAQSEFYAKTTITDCSLAYYSWLKSPQVFSMLPAQEILSYVRAAITPNAEKWYLYVSVIDELQREGVLSDEEYFDARYTLSAFESVAIHEGEIGKQDIQKILQKKDDFHKAEFQRKLNPIESENKALRSYIIQRNHKKAKFYSFFASLFVFFFATFIISLITTSVHGFWGNCIVSAISLLLIPLGSYIFVYRVLLNRLINKYQKEVYDYTEAKK